MNKQTEIVLNAQITMIFNGHEEVPQDKIQELSNNFANIIKGYSGADDVSITSFQTFLHGDVATGEERVQEFIDDLKEAAGEDEVDEGNLSTDDMSEM